MSLITKLVKLLNNPFLLAEEIAIVLKYYPTKRTITIFDTYLIGTLLMKEETRVLFKGKTINSSLETVFDKKTYLTLLNLEKDILSVKNRINKALLVAFNEKKLILSMDKKKISLGKVKENKIDNKEDLKILRGMGKVLGQYEIEELLNYTGVSKI